jgi:hypothetical protein
MRAREYAKYQFLSTFVYVYKYTYGEELMEN